MIDQGVLLQALGSAELDRVMLRSQVKQLTAELAKVKRDAERILAQVGAGGAGVPPVGAVASGESDPVGPA